MRRILFNFPGHEHNSLFDPHARDGVSIPFIYLRDRLAERGYELITADDHSVEESDWVWFWDTPNIALTPIDALKSLAKRILKPSSRPRDLYSECKRVGMLDRIVLFIGEPPVVLERNWDIRYHRRFPIIFTMNDNFVDEKRYFKYHFPLPSSFPEVANIPFEKKKLLVNISGNKFSNHPQELYSARRVTIRYFESHFPDDFDLYGMGWDEPGPNQAGYPSYRGRVDHKWNVYPLYKFGVCYENIDGVPGWVTEKIFDCLRGNCVPVYWGATDITHIVDQAAFIDRRQFDSEASLAEYLQQITAKDYQHYLDAGKEYLGSEKFKLFLPPTFSDTIIRVLNL